jgi:hypothetical protein
MSDNNEILTLDELYIKYFSVGFIGNNTISGIYHRTVADEKLQLPVVPAAQADYNNETEKMLRKALKLSDAGKKDEKNQGELSYDHMHYIYSLLANLPKLTEENLKKTVLFYFRNYKVNEATERDLKLNDLSERRDNLHLMVARAAVANKLATSYDYYNLIMENGSRQNKYINDLIAQAKLDIKAEMATYTPNYTEIETICRHVKVAAKKVGWELETLNMLDEEFNPELIIAGGEHFPKFEKTIETKRADLDKLETKAAWADKLDKENIKLRAENNALHTNMKKIEDEAKKMRASLFSRNVKKTRQIIAELTQPVIKGLNK